MQSLYRKLQKRTSMKAMANVECRPERGSFPLDHDGMIPSQESSLPMVVLATYVC
jgi:hypothetical protein